MKKKLFPNVDFYSGIISKITRISQQACLLYLFAIGRTVGWISQWKEMIEDPINKIGRPRQLVPRSVQQEIFQKESTREKKVNF